MVLLANRGGVLPLTPKIRSIALIGPHCNDTSVVLGNYHGIPSKVVTPLEAITARAALANITVRYSEGVAVEGDGLWMLEPVLEIVRASDVAVLCMGLSAKRTGPDGYAGGYVHPALEKESLDRRTLELPFGQRDLLMGITRQTKTPVVLVAVNGGPLSLEWELERVDAVLEAYLTWL